MKRLRDDLTRSRPRAQAARLEQPSVSPRPRHSRDDAAATASRLRLRRNPCTDSVSRRARHQPRLPLRSEEHTSELQSLMRISYAVFCLKKKTNTKHNI